MLRAHPLQASADAAGGDTEEEKTWRNDILKTSRDRADRLLKLRIIENNVL